MRKMTRQCEIHAHAVYMASQGDDIERRHVVLVFQKFVMTVGLTVNGPAIRTTGAILYDTAAGDNER
jgi:hypothetical protein